MLYVKLLIYVNLANEIHSKYSNVKQFYNLLNNYLFIYYY